METGVAITRLNIYCLTVMESRQRRREKLIVALIVLAIVAMFTFFLKDIMIPFIRLQMAHNVDGATELLREKGLQGFLSVAIIEALQMVVIFIPAEFIQISSGLSYPFPIALLLCDLGVGLGATIIFMLVRFFHVKSTAYERSRKNIDRISSNARDRNTVFLLYLLFFMPLIPFGAICYFGSGSNLRYRKYLFTVMTGVIPSIVVSNLMGAAGTAFLKNALPLWVLILIIVVLAALLFALIAFFIKRFIFKGTEETPDSLTYTITLGLARLWQGKPRHLTIDDELLHDVRTPYILLTNHESFPDFNYISRLSHPRNPSYLVNELFCTRPILKHLAKGGGFISKRLFTPDVHSAMGILRMMRRSYPVVIFPEGRLSPDGRSNPIVEGASFYRKLKVDLVLVRITGAYFSKPKWRKRKYQSNINLKVVRVITREELGTMTNTEVEQAIKTALYTDANETLIDTYPQADKAEGLEGLLYRCPDCGELYSTKGRGNTFFCKKCGARHTLNDRYLFEDDGKTSSIADFYDAIKALEAPELDTFELRTKVRTKIYGENGGPIRWENGECSLNSREFSYHSDKENFKVPTENLPAMAYSCNEEFELYHNNELHYFYPEKDRQQAARWALLVDMLAERRQKQKGETE